MKSSGRVEGSLGFGSSLKSKFAPVDKIKGTLKGLWNHEGNLLDFKCSSRLRWT